MKSGMTMLGMFVLGAMMLSLSGVTYAGISNGDPIPAQWGPAVSHDYGNSSWDKVVADTLSREPASKIQLARYYGKRAYYGPYPKRKYYRQHRFYRNPYYGYGVPYYGKG